MIVPLVNITLIGRQSQKEATIADLQSLGCLEIVPIQHSEAGSFAGASTDARTALRFLADCPTQRRQETVADGFDAAAFEVEVLEARNRTQDLNDRRDVLLQQVRQLSPWGEFTLPGDQELDGHRLWFYAVPNSMANRVDLSGYAHLVVKHDGRFRYVVLVAKQQPDLPLPPLKVTGSPKDMRDELDSVETQIEDQQIQRARLTRWRELFAKRLDALDDLAARQLVSLQAQDSEPVFALRAWCPQAARDTLVKYAAGHELAIVVASPAPGDEPPTLLDNPPRAAAGEGLVNFYMTPGYFTWDPSRLVLLSFAVFFAMIVADAGYAALMCLVVLWLWRRMGSSESSRRGRVVFSTVAIASLVYGIVVGSYFGWTPAPQSFLGAIALIDSTDAQTMMRLTILIGMGHLIYGNVRRALMKPRRAESLSAAGWAGILLGGGILWLGQEVDARGVAVLGAVVMIIGGLCVVLYTQPRQTLLRRLLGGVIGLTRITSAFGDVLSYLRLFALGLASASLAVAFNDLAAQSRSGAPRIGLVLAVLILLIGHTLNFVLSLMSGVVHGLRLNVIEFFNWGLPEEGRLFRPFRRKEKSHGTMGADDGLDRDIRPSGSGSNR